MFYRVFIIVHGFKEAFRLRVLRGLSWRRHADLRSKTLKSFHISEIALLHSTIRVVNEASGDWTVGQRHFQSLQGHIAVARRQRGHPIHLREEASRIHM